VPTCYRHPDRETGLSCTECDRPICTECLRMTPVGPRCPDHATTGRPSRQAPAPVRAQRRVTFAMRRGEPIVTWALIGANVLVYLVTVAQGFGINNPGGKLFNDWLLYGPAVAQGDWWRLITAAFLHANIAHIALNMLAIGWLGGPVERYVGHLRYLGIYIVSGLAGSAGALVVTPNAQTVGASGAVFGILGALLIIEYQQTGSIAGQAFSLIVLNLVFSFTFSGISVGGHIGGLIGGIASMLALSRFGRTHASYGRPGLVGVAALIGVGVVSVAIALWTVRGYA
jgi:membrane associated rhomboid family serine protease